MVERFLSMRFDVIVRSQRWEYIDADGGDVGRHLTLSISRAFRTSVDRRHPLTPANNGCVRLTACDNSIQHL